MDKATKITLRSVVLVIFAIIIAATGLVVATVVTWWLGLMIAAGALPMWGLACFANKTFFDL